ncbi:tRNA1Val (adenine37-N6)-methyltransferase [Desulfacinum hydrothermale DSM 13146]|uniref:tRNA1Val (Adenine37-N6)-methyltransferase n=1 Tax=Desulfacinum hydrothermale DSM 13146 TaxID=1121390 RepID=A0A1W1X752_9BACT|nr:methyltransferase [Desulfacinum hydrothermale]SMC19568.1 tRNA1Val (adenine37-N6)-methyltransferase [Desulfacinum hydrothermale DSM 13146]
MGPDRESTTRDSLFNGRLTLCQPRDGYRFSIDAVLLAGLTSIQPHEHVVELGTGCGVVLLVVAVQGKGRTWEGVEVQPELAELARANAELNGLSGRVVIHTMDVRKVPDRLPEGTADVVLSNPPYRRAHSGRINPNRQKAVARHELMGSLDDFFRGAFHLLREGGRFALIYPAARLDDLMVAAVGQGFRPKRLTLIHSRPGESARLVYMECRKGSGPEVLVTAPFHIYEAAGGYTEQMARLYQWPADGASNSNSKDNKECIYGFGT